MNSGRDDIWQAFVVILPVPTLGVTGINRVTYDIPPQHD